MATNKLAVQLRTILIGGLIACAVWAPASRAVYPSVGGNGFEFEEGRSLDLPDGRVLWSAGFDIRTNPPFAYSFVVYRMNHDHSWDVSFGGDGVVATSIWGYYEFAHALAVQADGKIVVGGNAADPIGKTDPKCHPASCKYYPALIRLNADGSLDKSFNRNGRIILAIGDANSGPEVGEFGTLSDIALAPDGKIMIYSGATAVARLNLDGTLDRSFAGASQIAREYLANYQGLWWNAPSDTESGWGISLAHQGDVIFATWFTYDATGKALWLSMAADETAEGSYAGTLYQTRGPAFSTMPFSSAAVTRIPVGPGTLAFNDTNNGSFSYTVNGIRQTKAITRQVFGTLPTCSFGAQPDLALATNYQDLWYAAPAESEAGWGISLAHQGDLIFATWFTYDADGTPLWLSATAPKTGPGTYAGTLYRTTGPAFNAVPFLPGNVAQTSVGTLTLTFANGNDATFAYTVKGVTQTKSIVRMVFRTPGTVCQ